MNINKNFNIVYGNLTFLLNYYYISKISISQFNDTVTFYLCTKVEVFF